MSGINIGRVLIGGLVAGVIANVFDYVIGMYLMNEEMTQMAQRLNLSYEKIQDSMYTWIAVDFIWGLVLVFAYAAFRPRFGPGPKTAAISGLLLWFAVCAVFAGLTSMGIYTQAAYMKYALFSLISTLAASLAGGAIYRE